MGVAEGEKFEYELGTHHYSMNWYYVSEGKQAGPFDDAQLDVLVNSGQVGAETLVWREGMANWQPYREARPSGTQPASLQTGVAVATSASPNEAVCSECGRVFPLENTIQYGTVRVCAGCKPVFMQKLAEGARIGGGLAYAGFWQRFAAVFLDGIILYIVGIVMALPFGINVLQAVGAQPIENFAAQMYVFFARVILGLVYEVVLIGKYGATLGKMACKIKVVTPDGGKVGYGRSFGRHFAKLLSAMICMIGYIVAAFDEEKRALHDRICNTRVITTS